MVSLGGEMSDFFAADFFAFEMARLLLNSDIYYIFKLIVFLGELEVVAVVQHVNLLRLGNQFHPPPTGVLLRNDVGCICLLGIDRGGD